VRSRPPVCLVILPTRELAKQVAADMESIGGKAIGVTCVYGGASIWEQEQALRAGVDIVVGTPGRMMDMMERGRLALHKIEYVVLDEADEMLNMGFSEDIEKILEGVAKDDPAVGQGCCSKISQAFCQGR